jgi:predicted nucleic acid-binding Zn ribbon protein
LKKPIFPDFKRTKDVMERICPECGNKILGRADKKFCSDGCRNAHNNALNKDTKNLMRNVNNRLRKNYRILESLNPTGKTKIGKDKLQRGGFDFSHFTSIYTTKAGTTYYYVYDQGYLPLADDFYLLVKKEIKE